ncbi:hypothetical protein Acsp02_05750 [Actinoplanes sp. NBRC 103695]|nr:hypothetical protein Acsp02_05750 [Actinoplanes sp. NBRC 103695]
MSGLGAETTEPEADETPVSPAAVEAPVEEEEPAEDEDRPTWFEPNTDARMQRPASLADKTFPPDREDAPEIDDNASATSKSDAAGEATGEETSAPAEVHDTAPESDDRLGEVDTEPEQDATAIEPGGKTATEAGEQDRAPDETADPEDDSPEPTADRHKAETDDADVPESGVDATAKDAAADTAKDDTAKDEPAKGETAEDKPGDAAADGPGDTAKDEPGDAAEEPADTSTEDEAIAADAGERLAAAVTGAAAVAVTTDSARNVGQPPVDPRSRLVDPEQVLSAYPFRFKPGTLREIADHPDQLRAVRDRLTDKLEYAERDSIRARLLSLRAVVSRVLGDLDFALADGRAALEHAERTGELRRTAMVQARLANVLRWRGDFAEADRLFEDANSPELPDRLRAEIAELAGRSAFEQDRYLEAMNRFEEALDLRRGEDPERAEVALDLVLAEIRLHGWGPYARTSDEIMGRPAPEPLETGETWALAQGYAEGLAWARRPGKWAWELVDAEGRTVIDGNAGYVQARPFSEGLAWVSRDPVGGWFAIDARNRLVVPGGFEDVMPFRNGVAAVKAGGWGAVDRYARPVVQPRYRRFATVLTGGQPVDGFTREGLAIVDAGDRLGVVDRRGQLVVAPVHPALVIHPVAFLIADRNGRWGALDREGEPLIEPVHRSEADVVDAIEELLADTRPVM